MDDNIDSNGLVELIRLHRRAKVDKTENKGNTRRYNELNFVLIARRFY